MFKYSQKLPKSKNGTKFPNSVLFYKVFFEEKEKFWIKVDNILFLKRILLASGSADKYIRIWETKDFKCINSLEGQTNEVNAVRFISSSLLSAGTWNDGTIDIWDLDKDSIVQQLRGHTSSVYSLKLIPNERRIKIYRFKYFMLI